MTAYRISRRHMVKVGTMDTHAQKTETPLRRVDLSIPPTELVRWLREELQENHQHLELYKSAWKQYSFEEDFDHSLYDIQTNEHVDLVSVEAVLDIEPLVEQGYWILLVKVTDEIGPLTNKEELNCVSTSLSLDRFEQEFLHQEHQSTEVFVMVETDEAKKQFDAWVRGMTARHGLKH